MAGDQTHITNITTLYTCNSLYLGRELTPQAWKEYRLRRPDASDVNDAIEECEELWEEFRRRVKPLRDVGSSRARAALYRKRGGHLLFRPVGLEMAVDAVSRAVTVDELGLDDAVSRLAEVPMALNRVPWRGLLWSEGGMETGKGRKALTRDLLSYMMGCRFWRGATRQDTAKRKLRERIASAINRTVEETTLPQRVA